MIAVSLAASFLPISQARTRSGLSERIKSYSLPPLRRGPSSSTAPRAASSRRSASATSDPREQRLDALASGDLRLAQETLQQRQLVAGDAVVGPAAALFTLDESGFAEDLEVVADGRLGEPERLGQVADARLVVGLGLDQAEQPQARWVGDHL